MSTPEATSSAIRFPDGPTCPELPEQNLSVPEGIVGFVDGAEGADDFVFASVRDRDRLALQRQAARLRIDTRGRPEHSEPDTEWR